MKSCVGPVTTPQRPLLQLLPGLDISFVIGRWGMTGKPPAWLAHVDEVAEEQRRASAAL
jgi:hypothetical protein